MAIAMTAVQFVDKLKHIASIKTVYDNHYPYNCGYYTAKTDSFSFDCWNLIKSVINGWTETKTDGYYQRTFTYTGDIDGATILSKCTEKGTDFTKLSKGGTYLFMSGHAGIYINNVVIDGKEYNCIECTTSWNSRKVIYSWVDNDGTRRAYRGGTVSKKWTNWGLMPWIDYSEPVKIIGEETKPITGIYNQDAFKYDVFTILGVSNETDALAKTVTISVLTNKNHKLVTPLERYFTAMGIYNGGIEADKGKTPCFGYGMKVAVKNYQKNVVKGTVDGEITAKCATWKKLLGIS